MRQYTGYDNWLLKGSTMAQACVDGGVHEEECILAACENARCDKLLYTDLCKNYQEELGPGNGGPIVGETQKTCAECGQSYCAWCVVRGETCRCEE